MQITNFRKQQRGFSLIEVLVSVVIMSVGILGVAGMQVVSLQQNRSSLLRAEAAQIASDILDRARANRTQNYAGVAFDDDPPGNEDCLAGICSASQMRTFDIAQWKCSVNSEDASNVTYPICVTYGIAGSLPNGSAGIFQDGSDADCPVEAGEICVVVRWTDDRDGNLASVSIRTRPN